MRRAVSGDTAVPWTEERRRKGTGDDLSGFVLNEMAGVLLDDPRLSADQLATLLALHGKALPVGVVAPGFG